MEIKNLLNGLDPYQQKAKVEKREAEERSATRAGQGERGDKVSLSPEAKLRTEAHKTASETPDVRREKVEELKAKLANGEYEVDSRKIAEKMLTEELDLFI